MGLRARKPTDRVTDPEPCEGCGDSVSITRFGGGQVAVENRGTNRNGEPIYMTHRHDR
jgi:hypothetical protein